MSWSLRCQLRELLHHKNRIKSCRVWPLNGMGVGI
ncbi:unnamed protein product [Linum tenue]|uniref:Uncharacterized protein n=1 Tax=Linum tenue TaxID=586396 RepID=A0AAV0H001_9ROSI|nr:unnamed protein product [Linum tenue]